MQSSAVAEGQKSYCVMNRKGKIKLSTQSQ